MCIFIVCNWSARIFYVHTYIFNGKVYAYSKGILRLQCELLKQLHKYVHTYVYENKM